MKFFLKDRLLIVGFELGLEIVEGLSAAVGSSSSVGEVEVGIFSFVAQGTPTVER